MRPGPARASIRPASGAAELAVAAALFRAYADGLGIDLGFQGFDAELAGLPGAYGPPHGVLLLAWAGDGVAPATPGAVPGATAPPSAGAGAGAAPATAEAGLGAAHAAALGMASVAASMPPAPPAMGVAASGAAIGCVAVRPLPGAGRDTSLCEMKRLFVAPAGRGLGLGRQLALAAMQAAAGLGYAQMRLDTLERLTPAVALYRQLGFMPVPAYHAGVVPGLLFLGRELVGG